MCIFFHTYICMYRYRETSEQTSVVYEKQIKRFIEQVHKNHKINQFKLAQQWMSIPGATVNYSFFENHAEPTFNKEEITKAFKDLGIDYNEIPGKKWWQFWINNDDVKFVNAILRL